MRCVVFLMLLIAVYADVSHLGLERQYLLPQHQHDQNHYIHSKPKALPDPPSVVVPRSNLNSFVADIPLRKPLFTPAGEGDVDFTQAQGTDQVLYATAPNSVFHTQINVQSQGNEFNAPNTLPIDIGDDDDDERRVRIGEAEGSRNYNDQHHQRTYKNNDYSTKTHRTEVHHKRTHQQPEHARTYETYDKSRTVYQEKRPNYQGLNLINGNIGADQVDQLPNPPQNLNGNTQGINVLNGNILGTDEQSRQLTGRNLNSKIHDNLKTYEHKTDGAYRHTEHHEHHEVHNQRKHEPHKDYEQHSYQRQYEDHKSYEPHRKHDHKESYQRHYEEHKQHEERKHEPLKNQDHQSYERQYEDHKVYTEREHDPYRKHDHQNHQRQHVDHKEHDHHSNQRQHEDLKEHDHHSHQRLHEDHKEHNHHSHQRQHEDHKEHDHHGNQRQHEYHKEHDHHSHQRQHDDHKEYDHHSNQRQHEYHKENDHHSYQRQHEDHKEYNRRELDSHHDHQNYQRKHEHEGQQGRSFEQHHIESDVKKFSTQHDRPIISKPAIKIIAFNNNINPSRLQLPIRNSFGSDNENTEFDSSATAPEVIYKPGDEIDFAETKLIDYYDNRRPLDNYRYSRKKPQKTKPQSDTDLRKDGYHYSKPSINFDS